MDEDAPAMFVSFPSLKNPAHEDPDRHTGEIVAICRWEPFAAWAESSHGHRPEDYEAAKAWIAESLLAQFKRHFPRLAPLVDFHELSTPLSQAAFVGADRGAMYGIEMSAARLESGALGVRYAGTRTATGGTGRRQSRRSGGVHGRVHGRGLDRAAVVEGDEPLSGAAVQRQTSTGTVASARTLLVWLPSSRREIPRRLWEAMTIRSQRLRRAALMISR